MPTNRKWKSRSGVSSGRWATIRRRIFDRDGWRCVLCRRPGRLECDHIVGLAEGGDNSPENLRTLCRDCHIRIGREEREARNKRQRHAPGFNELVQELLK